MDDVSMGEVARRLTEVKEIVQDLVGRREYGEYRQHVEHRFAEIERDVAKERDDRKEADKVLADRMDKASTNWRANLWQAGGAALVLFGMAINVWVALRGR